MLGLCSKNFDCFSGSGPDLVSTRVLTRESQTRSRHTWLPTRPGVRNTDKRSSEVFRWFSVFPVLRRLRLTRLLRDFLTKSGTGPAGRRGVSVQSSSPHPWVRPTEVRLRSPGRWSGGRVTLGLDPSRFPDLLDSLRYIVPPVVSRR